MDEDIEPNEQQNEQEDHVEHESHERNNTNTDINPPQEDSYYVPQEHNIDPIKESLETKTTA